MGTHGGPHWGPHWGPRRPRLPAVTAIVGAMALAVGSAALADVKDGVDAWSAGDYAGAVAEWRGPAAKGDADALFNLAQAYRLGRGVQMDPKQAETYYARAAAKGHLKAADNYGLLLFQDGRRDQAMPYVKAASERGDPRAQYLLGIAHFNGDLVPKDWVRAYALLTLANGAGLPQASAGLKEMDDFVPLAQRQQAQGLAAQIRKDADAARTSQMAAADLGDGPTSAGVPPVTAGTPPAIASRPDIPRPVQAVAVPPSISAAEAAVAEAMRATGTESPATAGADFARRKVGPAVTPGAAPVSQPVRVAQAAPPKPSPAPTAAAPVASGGPWKLQLGAFSVAGNADKAWIQVAARAALAGKDKLTLKAGNLTRLLASGWPSQAAAQAACNQLKGSGQACLVTR